MKICTSVLASLAMLFQTHITCGLNPVMAATSIDTADLCERAAYMAAEKTGVPVKILLAISRIESGRDMGKGVSAWPWAVNHDGTGTWFPSKEDAKIFISQELALGAGNIDIGCFQLNYRWHSGRFAGLEEMLDPDENALQAAYFLKELYAEARDWRAAVAAYHSRSIATAQAYLTKFDVAFGTSDLQTSPIEAKRSNAFPLLQLGKTGRNGSIVPSLLPSSTGILNAEVYAQ